MHAPVILAAAEFELGERAQTYDQPGGERAGQAVAVAFNAITGHSLTAAHVYQIMALVKQVRFWSQPGFNRDHPVDCAAFVALMGESRAQEAAERAAGEGW